MSDRLAALLKHFSMSARTFQAGALCGINRLDGTAPYGQLHLIRQGEVGVFYWVESGAGYALVGALPKERLLAIAEAIYRQLPASEPAAAGGLLPASAAR